MASLRKSRFHSTAVMLMKIHRATRLYEAWLAKQIHLVPSDLALKHKTMKRDTFLFF
ncbi:MAG: hypothetical protein AAB433_20215 [Nitrospirota bacterium]